MIGIRLFYFINNKDLPIGEKGPKADALAHKMLSALNEDALKTTKYLEWSFNSENHKYNWDKTQNITTVSWKDNIATLHLSNPNKSKVLLNNIEVSADEKEDLLKKASSYFNNDSFWLLAPYKVLDNGTQRSIVTLENGEEALLVTYNHGGTTSGYSYLWKLNPDGSPESFQMWVKNNFDRRPRSKLESM